MKLNRNILRQGDVLLVRTGDSGDVAPSRERVVLKEGEVTFHAHAFMAESRVSFLGREHLAVGQEATLSHEEHAPAVVRAGLYDVPQQCEWNDAMEPIAVAD